MRRGPARPGDGPAYTQAQAARAVRRLPPADVLVCHCPPLGVNDDPDDPSHVGFAALREWVLEHRPRVLLHGHTYPQPGRRVARLAQTRGALRPRGGDRRTALTRSAARRRAHGPRRGRSPSCAAVTHLIDAASAPVRPAGACH